MYINIQNQLLVELHGSNSHLKLAQTLLIVTFAFVVLKLIFFLLHVRSW